METPTTSTIFIESSCRGTRLEKKKKVQRASDLRDVVLVATREAYSSLPSQTKGALHTVIQPVDPPIDKTEPSLPTIDIE